MAKPKYNPRNPKNRLYRQLTRLLSGPLQDYKKQVPRRYNRNQINRFGNNWIWSSSGQSFKRDRYNPYDTIAANYMANQNRTDRYIDFDQMEYTPEIASSLDIYADEMTTSTNINPLLELKCNNQEIKLVLENLYHKILNVEFNLFGWCRSMCKYGDFFLYLDVDEKDGIQHALGLPANEIERIEGEDKTNPNYVQFQWNAAGITLENWQMAHFRILGNDKYVPYGTSVLEPARRIWRQLTLMEDAVMAYRIVRSPERRVFYIDVGNISPEDVEQYMQKVMSQMKRNQVVDANSGRVDLRYNPMSVEEDYFIPQRAGQNTRVESLPGGTYTGDIEDIKYLRDKLFSALKVPASYLAQSEGASEDKTTLAQKDIRFARTIQRLQRAVVSELEKVGIIHLFTLGYRASDLLAFKISLNNPSKLAELQELETWRTKFDVASSATEGYFSKRWVSKHLFNLPDEEIVRMQREMFQDKKHAALLEKAVEMETTDGDGGLGEIGGAAEEIDLGGGEGGEELDLEGGEETEAAADTGEEETLLAEPGKRDDGPPKKIKKDKLGRSSTTTAKSKGKWYKPVEWDGRKDQKRKSYKGLYADEFARSSQRAVRGFASQELMNLGKGVVSEENESTYNIEEEKLLQLNYDVKMLIKELESKDK